MILSKESMDLVVEVVNEQTKTRNLISKIFQKQKVDQMTLENKFSKVSNLKKKNFQDTRNMIEVVCTSLKKERETGNFDGVLSRSIFQNQIFLNTVSKIGKTCDELSTAILISQLLLEMSVREKGKMIFATPKNDFIEIVSYLLTQKSIKMSKELVYRLFNILLNLMHDGPQNQFSYAIKTQLLNKGIPKVLQSRFSGFCGNDFKLKRKLNTVLQKLRTKSIPTPINNNRTTPNPQFHDNRIPRNNIQNHSFMNGMEKQQYNQFMIQKLHQRRPMFNNSIPNTAMYHSNPNPNPNPNPNINNYPNVSPGMTPKILMNSMPNFPLQNNLQMQNFAQIGSPNMMHNLNQFNQQKNMFL